MNQRAFGKVAADTCQVPCRGTTQSFSAANATVWIEPYLRVSVTDPLDLDDEDEVIAAPGLFERGVKVGASRHASDAATASRFQIIRSAAVSPD
ncbi:MAG TPA: hypothetical protein VF834_17360 [Streptosporangiaceae bacterium]